METPTLTARQKQVVDAISGYTAVHGYAPSIREIGKMLGVSSPSGVWSIVQDLIDMGVLTGEPKLNRTLRVVER